MRFENHQSLEGESLFFCASFLTQELSVTICLPLKGYLHVLHKSRFIMKQDLLSVGVLLLDKGF